MLAIHAGISRAAPALSTSGAMAASQAGSGAVSVLAARASQRLLRGAVGMLRAIWWSVSWLISGIEWNWAETNNGAPGCGKKWEGKVTGWAGGEVVRVVWHRWSVEVGSWGLSFWVGRQGL